MKRYLFYKAFIVSLFSQLVSAGVSDTPLFLSDNIAPNVLINLSVEVPMGGAAYNDQRGPLDGGTYCQGRVSNTGRCFFPTTEEYIGYFDSKKCYQYNGDGRRIRDQYFEPVSLTNSRGECHNSFSGNFLNWATMTSVDMLVKTSTGGNRIIDETTGANPITSIRRATTSGYFQTKYISAALASKYTPLSGAQNWYIVNQQNHVEFYYLSRNNRKIKYRHFGRGRGPSTQLQVQVRVCNDKAANLGESKLEENCERYTNSANQSYYKPVGFIQRNANNMRFAVASYANDNRRERDGGVLRANMKYVGPTLPSKEGADNPNKEIDTNGALLRFPDGRDSNAVRFSGVINYINKFSKFGYKSFDPAAELYYEAIRYFKHLTPTPEYSRNLYNEKFPVVTNWQDPIQYSCQKNFIIGMNDAYTWADKKLPGTKFTHYIDNGRFINWGDYGEPSNPDRDINVRQLTNKIGELENLNQQNCLNDKRKLGECINTDRETSFYLAGLAHYANQQDIRKDLPGKQSITSFFIDSQEYKTPPSRGKSNVLWLAGKYGGYIDKDNDGTPLNANGNLEWDSDNNGTPDNYVLASSPKSIVKGISNAFEQIEARTASATGITLNSSEVKTGTILYQTSFNSDTWQGDLTAYRIENGLSQRTIKWRLSEQLAPAHKRNIFSYANNKGISFKHTNLSSTQKSLISHDQLEYLRGDQSKEQKNNGTFRNRETTLGDIAHSRPVQNTQHDFGFDRLTGQEGIKYKQYRNSVDYRSRTNTLFFGANDGMLHAVNADSGSQLFSYFPSSILPEALELTSQNYKHKYFVDAEAAITDAYLSSSWKTVLVGARGRGGSTIFALDVSKPQSFDKENVLWEISAQNNGFSDLGAQLGKVKIGRLNNGKWAAIFGNGYQRDNPSVNPEGKSILYIVDLESGKLIKKIDTSQSSNNGLSEATLLDTNNDLSIDYIYAGDLQGNLWKFDISSADIDDWQIANRQASLKPSPLFKAQYPKLVAGSIRKVNQPITTAPTIKTHPNGGHLLLFGTGKYFEAKDSQVFSSDPIQSFYGIHDDKLNVISDRNQLVAQNFIYQQNSGANTVASRSSTNKTVNFASQKGWYIDLHPPTTTTPSVTGERVHQRALLYKDKVIFFTTTPTATPCEFGGTSWRLILNSLDGGAGDKVVSDENNDGKIDDNDKLYIRDKDGNVTQLIATGKQSKGITAGGTLAGNKLILHNTKGGIEEVDLFEDDGPALKPGRLSWQQIR